MRYILFSHLETPIFCIHSLESSVVYINHIYLDFTNILQYYVPRIGKHPWTNAKDAPWLLWLTPRIDDVYSKTHYNDVIIDAITLQITSFTIVYSIVYSDADQRKHQSSASLAFVRGIQRGPVISRTNGQLRGTCFHLMTSSWKRTKALRAYFYVI